MEGSAADKTIEQFFSQLLLCWKFIQFLQKPTKTIMQLPDLVDQVALQKLQLQLNIIICCQPLIDWHLAVQWLLDDDDDDHEDVGNEDDDIKCNLSVVQ